MIPEGGAVTAEDPTQNLPGSTVGSQVLLVCEHATAYIPAELNHLGLSGDILKSHIAWDPGAFEVASHLSNLMSAPLVSGTVSRLVYDCNRPPDAEDAIPEKSENIAIPGNVGLSQNQRLDRIDRYYRPFENRLKDAIQNHQYLSALVTIHSFTPVYFDAHRSVELGILHDKDTALADAILRLASDHVGLNTLRNQPYGPADGVTHTLKVHGEANGLLNVMIEIRNDLISDPVQCENMAGMLRGLLEAALIECGVSQLVRSAQA